MLPPFEFDIPWESIDKDTFSIGILVECVTVFYAFIGLAIVCDEHMVPALDTLCIKWKIPEDVAGATFMAFGSAAPEIIIATVTTIQSMDTPDPDATALGVTSVVGSGLLAFSIIPALCGIYGSENGLVLSRRPLLRDQIAYLAALLMLMYTITDKQIHVWEAAVMFIIYLIYLFVIVFAGSIRKWYLRNFHKDYYWRKYGQTDGGAGSLKEPLQMDVQESPGFEPEQTAATQQWGKPMYLHFNARPLGFSLINGEDGKNAIVDSHIRRHEQAIVGTTIVEVNGRNCINLDFEEITEMLQQEECPLTIMFQRPPEKRVEQWSNARVKRWWMETLPPVLQVHAGIVDECQIDGSDLLELDMEMLQEFGIKRIYAMKVLKYIEKLQGHQQVQVGNDANKILHKLEHWEISPGVINKLKEELHHKQFNVSDRGGSHGHGHGHEGGSESSEGEHGPMMEIFEKAIYPMELLLASTCPECQINTPEEDWYLFTFGMSFFWVAIFSFIISSVVERWVTLSGMPMSFFGLLVVSVAAQTPDTLESLAVSKKGYGSMAVANCQGTQTINIGIGLAIPWMVSAGTGSVIELQDELIIPCWIMVFLLISVMAIEYSDVIFKGAEKVILNRTRAYLMTIVYCVSIIMYAVYLIEEGEFNR